MKLTVDWCSYRTNFYGVDGLEFLALEPIPVFKYYHRMATANYRKCPAHQNQFKNTFVVCSPIDIEVNINKEEAWCDVVEPKGLPKEVFNPRFGEEHESPYPLFTFRMNRIMLTPQNPSIDVYAEQLDPSLEWDRNMDIRIVEGNFNISKWTRPLEASYEQKHKNMIVKFKRGQPMYYIRLSTNDPDDIITLNRIEMDEKLYRDSERCLQVKEFFPNKKLKVLYDIKDNFISSFKKEEY